MDNQNKDRLKVKEVKENKGITYKGITELLSFVISCLITHDLFIAKFFICDNWIQIVIVSIFCVISFYALIFGLCNYLVKNSK